MQKAEISTAAVATSGTSTTGCSMKVSSGTIASVPRRSSFELQMESRPIGRSPEHEVDDRVGGRRCCARRRSRLVLVARADIQNGSYSGLVREQTLCRLPSVMPARFSFGSSFRRGRSQHRLRAPAATPPRRIVRVECRILTQLIGRNQRRWMYQPAIPRRFRADGTTLTGTARPN